jgi:hypothetical protein
MVPRWNRAEGDGHRLDILWVTDQSTMAGLGLEGAEMRSAEAAMVENFSHEVHQLEGVNQPRQSPDLASNKDLSEEPIQA